MRSPSADLDPREHGVEREPEPRLIDSPDCDRFVDQADGATTPLLPFATAAHRGDSPDIFASSAPTRRIHHPARTDPQRGGSDRRRVLQPSGSGG